MITASAKPAATGVMPASRSRIVLIPSHVLSPQWAPNKPFRASAARGFGHGEDEKRRHETMSIIDKLTGRAKQAAGDLAGDGSLRREGRQEERKGEAKDELANAEDRVEDKAAEVANLERKTN